MFRRSRAKPAACDPLVTDRHGRVIGVRTPPPEAQPEAEASRMWRRRRNLAETGELRRQAELRNQVSVFHVDPGPSVRR